MQITEQQLHDLRDSFAALSARINELESRLIAVIDTAELVAEPELPLDTEVPF